VGEGLESRSTAGCIRGQPVIICQMANQLIIVLVALVAAGHSKLVRVPGGYWLDESCIFEAKDGHVKELSRCATPGKPAVQMYDLDVNYSPPSGSVSHMNTSWAVPPLPEQAAGQVVYFWPGFKSSQPVMGYPVLQPVLQYGQQGPYWMLQSWFVWGQQGIAYTGTAIPIKPGNVISSYMSYSTTARTWTVYGQNTATKDASVLKVSLAKIDHQAFQWAMVVLETIMDTGYCKYYPGGNHNVTFTGIKVNNLVVSNWNAQQNGKDCNQTITFDNSGDVTMTWSDKSE